MTTIQQANQNILQQAIYDRINGSGPSAPETAASTGATDGGASPVYLTPEALMLYCQTRLQGIDSQVQTAMAQQQSINSEQGSIGALLQQLATDSAAAKDGVMNNADECKAIEQNLEDLIAQIQQKDPGCSQLGQLEQLHDSIMATGSGPYPDPQNPQHGYYCSSSTKGPGGAPDGTTPPPNANADHDGILGASELTNFTNTLNNINSALGSGAEMGMIKIQSLMSDRTTAIQLTTSILQSYDDGLSKIANNIGK